MLVFCISSQKSLKIRPLSISYSYRTKEKTAFHERLNWFSYTYSVKDFSEKNLHQESDICLSFVFHH